MRTFEMYSELLGLPYDDGDRDCYGLCRRFYLKNYDIELPNYARSSSFFADGIAASLIADFFIASDFKVVDVPFNRLEVGDGLLLCVPVPGWPRGEANHVGVYVGNGLFAHHLINKQSCEDSLSDAWKRRILSVVRHPMVTEKNKEMTSGAKVDVLSLLPDHVKQKYGLVAPAVLEPVVRESGVDPDRQPDSGAAKRKSKPRSKSVG